MRDWMLTMALTALSMLGLVACTSDGNSSATLSDPRVVSSSEIASIGEGVDSQEASSAAAVALADDRLTDLLRANPHEVESVRAACSSAGLAVSVRFDAPLGGPVST